MKKLMLTTAIASVLTTAAIAQTTITGELRVNYKSVEADKGYSTLRSISAANVAGGTQTLDALGAVTPNTASGLVLSSKSISKLKEKLLDLITQLALQSKTMVSKAQLYSMKMFTWTLQTQVQEQQFHSAEIIFKDLTQIFLQRI